MKPPSTLLTHRFRMVVWAFALFGGLVGVFAGQSPTGLWLFDTVLAFAFGVVVVLAASRAHSWALLFALAPAALLVAGGWGIVGILATATVAIALAAAPESFRRSRWRPPLGALAGLTLVVTFAHLDDKGFTFASAVCAAFGAGAVCWSGWRGSGRATRRRWRTPLLLGGVAVAAVVGLTLLGAIQARWHAELAEQHLDDAFRYARDGDRDQLQQSLRAAGTELQQARDWVDAWWTMPGRAVPVVSQNIRVTSDTLAVVADVVAELEPAADLADLDGLAVVDGAVDVDAVRALAAQVRPAADAIDAAIAWTRRPNSPWLAGPVDRGIARMTATLDDFGVDLSHASDVLDVLPTMLGADDPQRYLVMFVTPSEARGGGFAGQTAELVFDDGRFTLANQRRTSDINPTGGRTWTLQGAEEYLGLYERFRVTSEWRNITMSPDFPTVAHVAQQAYEQSTGVAVDGVLRVGPNALAALLSITGPIEFAELDEPLTADNVVTFVNRDQYGTTFADNDTRIDVLGDLVELAIDELVATPIDDPRRLGQAFSSAIASGDLAMWHRRPEVQTAIEQVRLHGAIPTPDGGDSLFVTQHDLLPNKIDAWSQREVRYDIAVDDASGAVTGSVEVRLHNGAPTNGSGYQVSTGDTGLPVATMREMVTIYTPHALSDITVDGRPAPFLAQSELGHLAYRIELEIAPGDTAVIHAAVSGTAALPYRLTLPITLVANTERIVAKVNGTVLHDGELRRETRIALSTTR